MLFYDDNIIPNNDEMKSYWNDEFVKKNNLNDKKNDNKFIKTYEKQRNTKLKTNQRNTKKGLILL